MIRELAGEELDLMLPIGEAFAAEANYPGGFSLDAFKASWEPLLMAGLGKVFIAEENGVLVAALGMAFLPDSYSGAKTASELFWFVVQSHRASKVGMELFNRFEAEGIACGAKKLVMVHLSDLTPERLEKFFVARGYRAVEKTYWRML